MGDICFVTIENIYATLYDTQWRSQCTIEAGVKRLMCKSLHLYTRNLQLLRLDVLPNLPPRLLNKLHRIYLKSTRENARCFLFTNRAPASAVYTALFVIN